MVADSPRIDAGALFFSRELSLLAFNERVLEQAADTEVPLLERLRYLCISSTNLDEFFEIRIAGLKQRLAAGELHGETDTPASSAAGTLRTLSVRAHQLVDRQYQLLNEVLQPALEAEQIRFIRRGDWNAEQEQWLEDFFRNELLPVLSPIGLDPAHPFPRILNKSLNFIVSLEGKDAFGRNSGMAIVQAPRSLPRLIPLPTGIGGSGPYDYVFLSSIIHAFSDQLFPGMEIRGCYQFRVTRNSDLFVDEEEVDDLLHALQGELPARRYGDAVRLEVADNCPPDMARFLARQFHLEEDDIYQVNGPVNLNRLLAIVDLVDRPDLKFPPFTPQLDTSLWQGNVFATLRRRDMLLYHPFDSFVPVIDFLRQAARDSKVLAIKMTLYRTGPDSIIVETLASAARAGKEVTVVIELRARFDEEENIAVASRLQEAGAHVVYGVVGYKTHAKMTLVIRREKAGLRHYVHLGTGNYHPKTARVYTDYGLFTSDAAIGDDVRKIFLQLTSLGKVTKLKKLLQSPFTLHSGLSEKIRRETEHAAAGRPARIIIKVNSLVEKTMIRSLYAASQAGVAIQLIVRGMCRLRPGVAGISDNIEVRSIVGRFLEHSRVYYFENDGAPEVYCASADLMERNLYRRVEACFPIEDPQLRQGIIEDLHRYLADNTHAWILQEDGEYRRLRPAPGEAARHAQAEILAAHVRSPSPDD